MSKGIILYFSVKGSTEQYARWLAEATGFPACDVRKEKVPDCSGYDCIVFGSCVRIGQVKIKKWITKLWPAVKGKKLFLFSVSGADPREEVVQEYFIKNFSEEIREQIAYFPLGGRYIFSDMPKILQFFLKMAAKAEKDEKARDALINSIDRVSKESLDSLIAAVKKS